MKTDSTLLREYAETGDEAAFTEVVRRHVNLVYASAVRLLNGDAALAQDVTQTVFTSLARRATGLDIHTSLAGWLHTSVRYAASHAVRGEQRRRTHEQEASRMNDLTISPEATWLQLRPLIDAAVGQLQVTERDALLLRFFEDLGYREVGEALGLTENAARMRVERAMEKLRAYFSRHGVTTTAALLASTLGAGAASEPIPTGLAATVAGKSLSGAHAVTAAASAATGGKKYLTAKVAGLLAAAAALGAVATVSWIHSRRPAANTTVSSTAMTSVSAQSTAATAPVPAMAAPLAALAATAVPVAAGAAATGASGTTTGATVVSQVLDATGNSPQNRAISGEATPNGPAQNSTASNGNTPATSATGDSKAPVTATSTPSDQGTEADGQGVSASQPDATAPASTGLHFAHTHVSNEAVAAAILASQSIKYYAGSIVNKSIEVEWPMTENELSQYEFAVCRDFPTAVRASGLYFRGESSNGFLITQDGTRLAAIDYKTYGYLVESGGKVFAFAWVAVENSGKVHVLTLAHLSSPDSDSATPDAVGHAIQKLLTFDSLNAHSYEARLAPLLTGFGTFSTLWLKADSGGPDLVYILQDEHALRALPAGTLCTADEYFSVVHPIMQTWLEPVAVARQAGWQESDYVTNTSGVTRPAKGNPSSGSFAQRPAPYNGTTLNNGLPTWGVNPASGVPLFTAPLEALTADGLLAEENGTVAAPLTWATPMETAPVAAAPNSPVLVGITPVAGPAPQPKPSVNNTLKPVESDPFAGSENATLGDKIAPQAGSKGLHFANVTASDEDVTKAILARSDPLIQSIARSADANTVAAQSPMAGYNLLAGTFTDGSGARLSNAKKSKAYKYLVESDGKFILIASVGVDNFGTVNVLNLSPGAGPESNADPASIATALQQLSTLNPIKAHSYEVRLLTTTDIGNDALTMLWLKGEGSGNDLVYIPNQPGVPKPLRTGVVYTADLFFNLVQPMVEKKIQAVAQRQQNLDDSESSNQPPDGTLLPAVKPKPADTFGRPTASPFGPGTSPGNATNTWVQTNNGQ